MDAILYREAVLAWVCGCNRKEKAHSVVQKCRLFNGRLLKAGFNVLSHYDSVKLSGSPTVKSSGIA